MCKDKSEWHYAHGKWNRAQHSHPCTDTVEVDLTWRTYACLRDIGCHLLPHPSDVDGSSQQCIWKSDPDPSRARWVSCTLLLKRCIHSPPSREGLAPVSPHYPLALIWCLSF
ncbi:hypothetical protein JZ751_003719 [Albula glossodonta]|uniref:Uncharacterized protein n=1 Tax=Albula glossodonta TaxID=121402 RepID=A0A8T2P7P7_9TELE|nr:hypothetical protein JZ751_003719 [Albula glossodonta]